MVKAVYPGSFDPITNGHMDIINRAAKVVDELIIGVATNSAKNHMFSLDERIEIIKEATKDIENVTVMKFEGLTVDCAKKLGASVIIRGLRAVTDFENEMQLAQTNHHIDSDIDTMFFVTSLEYAFLSSTIVKELAMYGSDISKLVPAAVLDRFLQKSKHSVN